MLLGDGEGVRCVGTGIGRTIRARLGAECAGWRVIVVGNETGKKCA